VDLDTDFAADSLFCEWAYVVDLDAQQLEAYKGFQKEKHDRGRFAGMEPKRSPRTKAVEYYPIAKFAEWKFDALPADTNAFVKACMDALPREDED
jgi:hypothetical protein